MVLWYGSILIGVGVLVLVCLAISPFVWGVIIAIVIIVVGFNALEKKKALEKKNALKEDKDYRKKIENALAEKREKALIFFDKLCQKYILIGTEVYLEQMDINDIEEIGAFCKKHSTAILMPGVQYCELESYVNTLHTLRSQYDEAQKLKSAKKLLNVIANMVKDGTIKIAGMSYSPTQTSRTDTIEALVRYAENVIQEKITVAYITDDPALKVRINSLQSNNNIIEFYSADLIQRMRSQLHCGGIL